MRFPNHTKIIDFLSSISDCFLSDYLSYGGEAQVEINSLKFLKREFISLPIQAINVRLFNLNKEKKWKSDIISYLLNIVQGKIYTCALNGIIADSLCITLSDTAPNTLNKRLITDGYAIHADDILDVDVSVYNYWLQFFGKCIFVNPLM